MTSAAISRQQILDAFGVTEDDLAAIEAETGWNAAREAAEQEREEFVARMRQHAAETCEELSRNTRSSHIVCGASPTGSD